MNNSGQKVPIVTVSVNSLFYITILWLDVVYSISGFCNIT